jgi:hypothetical protein
MKKELADDEHSLMSGPAPVLHTDTTYKTKTVVKSLEKLSIA